VHVRHAARHLHMEARRATQRSCFGQVDRTSAICRGHRYIVGGISFGLQAPHAVGMLISAAGVSKTMTYVRCCVDCKRSVQADVSTCVA
jgi:hypothetical protein